MKKILGASALALLVPSIAFAQTVQDIIGVVSEILNLLIPLLIILAIIFFFWGLVKFIMNAGNEDARGEGVRIMIWGVIALFVIVSVWGLVALLQDTFGVTQEAETVGSPTDFKNVTPQG